VGEPCEVELRVFVALKVVGFDFVVVDLIDELPQFLRFLTGAVDGLV
jgi:hypothetical protein